jgi:cytoskeletal protein RodZ
MNQTPHPAVVARRRRVHRLRVRIASGVVGLFIAIFSVIYAQAPSTAKTTNSTNRVASSSSSTSSTSSSTTTTPMTTSQS